MAYDSTVDSESAIPVFLITLEVLSSFFVNEAPLVDTDPENTNPVAVDLIV